MNFHDDVADISGQNNPDDFPMSNSSSGVDFVSVGNTGVASEDEACVPLNDYASGSSAVADSIVVDPIELHPPLNASVISDPVEADADVIDSRTDSALADSVTVDRSVGDPGVPDLAAMASTVTDPAASPHVDPATIGPVAGVLAAALELGAVWASLVEKAGLPAGHSWNPDAVLRVVSEAGMSTLIDSVGELQRQVGGLSALVAGAVVDQSDPELGGEVFPGSGGTRVRVRCSLPRGVSLRVKHARSRPLLPPHTREFRQRVGSFPRTVSMLPKPYVPGW